MPRLPDSGHVDLARMFLRVQEQMLADLAVGETFEHPTASGAATEQQWIALLNRYLPRRYRASSAFIVDAAGRRSRQIDIAIYDHFYSPLLFPHQSGLHVPAESVYAVFEVKHELTRQWLRDAGRKAASVRALHRTSVPVIAAGATRPAIRPRPILAGVVAVSAVWRGTFQEKLPDLLRRMPPNERLDLGCILREGAFEWMPSSRSHLVRLSTAPESLLFFIVRLLERLRSMGTAPAADLMQYARSLTSFTK